MLFSLFFFRFSFSALFWPLFSLLISKERAAAASHACRLRRGRRGEGAMNERSSRERKEGNRLAFFLLNRSTSTSTTTMKTEQPALPRDLLRVFFLIGGRTRHQRRRGRSRRQRPPLPLCRPRRPRRGRGEGDALFPFVARRPSFFLVFRGSGGCGCGGSGCGGSSRQGEGLWRRRSRLRGGLFGSAVPF